MVCVHPMHSGHLPKQLPYLAFISWRDLAIQCLFANLFKPVKGFLQASQRAILGKEGQATNPGDCHPKEVAGAIPLGKAAGVTEMDFGLSGVGWAD